MHLHLGCYASSSCSTHNNGRSLQVASFGIVINQMWSLMDEIFTSDCNYCRGTGRIICRHCHGTKTLRSRPGEFHYQHMAVVDRSPKDL